MTANAERLVRLLQLASPALPVGAYSYSGGLEAAVEAGIVSDAQSAARWIGDVLEHSVARMEAPMLLRLLAAWREGDRGSVALCNERVLAGRETAELRAETAQMGYSLARLLRELGLGEIGLSEIAYPTAFAFAAAGWEIEPQAALQAYLWSWLENQALAAVKSVPLGQTEAQKMVLSLGSAIPRLAARAQSLAEEEWTNFAPGLALLSARHETQYSRLFRS